MRTAVVTGGSRGVGRGVVEGLCEAGFHVDFTGRNRARLAAVQSEAATLGGTATAHVVDHRDDAQVSTLFEPIDNLDLLVNCTWGGYEAMGEDGQFTWPSPYWIQPLWRWDAMMQTGVRAAYVASQLATRTMIAHGSGLIVNLSFWAAQKHLGNVVYGMAKAATDKMTSDMAEELASAGHWGVHVVSLYPGLVRTERVMENAQFLDLSNSESPRFIGRTVAALALDERTRREATGNVVVAAALARSLGVSDVDGSSPIPLTVDDT